MSKLQLSEQASAGIEIIEQAIGAHSVPMHQIEAARQLVATLKWLSTNAASVRLAAIVSRDEAIADAVRLVVAALQDSPGTKVSVSKREREPGEEG